MTNYLPDDTSSADAHPLQLVIVNSGLSTPSTTLDVASRVASAAEEQIKLAGHEVNVTTIELRALAGDLATFMGTTIATPELEKAKAQVQTADALVAATPIFQGSYAGLFKLFFDVFDKHALNDIPVTLVATAGTARHSLILDYAMRPLLSFLQAMVMPTGVFVATDDFGGDEELQPRFSRAGQELALHALETIGGTTQLPAASRQTKSRTSEIEDDFTIPDGGFASLLKGHSGD